MTKLYSLKAKVWLYPGMARSTDSTRSLQAGSWHFVTLPKSVAKNIDFYFSTVKRGWGSLRVDATIGKTTWKTSIFPDKKSDSYLLPLKAHVRKQESIKEGDSIKIVVEIKA